MSTVSPLARQAAAAAIGLSVLAPGLSAHIGGPLLIAALLLGLTHGALDDHVEASLSGKRRGRLSFYVAYLSGIGAVALLWWLSPALALAVFLVVAGLHFGEADTQSLRVSPGARRVLVLSRGFVVVLLPLVVWPAETWPNIAALIDAPLPPSPPWMAALAVPLLAQHLSAYGALSSGEPAVFRDAALLSGLFLFATPELSLAVYFGLWHATRHLSVLRGALGWDSLHKVLRSAAPLTVASLAGLLVLAAGALVLDEPRGLLLTTLLLISGLTLPHTLLTHQLLQRLP